MRNGPSRLVNAFPNDSRFQLPFNINQIAGACGKQITDFPPLRKSSSDLDRKVEDGYFMGSPIGCSMSRYFLHALKDTLHAQHAIRCDLSGNTIHSKTRLWEKRHDGSGQGSPERRGGLALPLLKYPNNGRRGKRGCLMKNMTNPLAKRGCSPAISRTGGHGHPSPSGGDPVSLSVRCLGDASSPLCIQQRASAKLDIYLISRL
ncbi:hypothetical protein CDAR_18351 [Caerostris darwini]|uniref:Uncharacterized protein n=1 Tax=Caerostris darwini TaxID=1538125 RepID=A0AAV4V980_9ARAC|nr:hypothetical protein CDAR_18351 [Caerostris darwini]